MELKPISFRQYLDTKEQLQTAMLEPTTLVVTYNTIKYCCLSVGPNFQEREYIKLKPSNTIIVYFKPLSNNSIKTVVEFNGSNYNIFWAEQKIASWIKSNTEIINVNSTRCEINTA